MGKRRPKRSSTWVALIEMDRVSSKRGSRGRWWKRQESGRRRVRLQEEARRWGDGRGWEGCRRQRRGASKGDEGDERSMRSRRTSMNEGGRLDQTTGECTRRHDGVRAEGAGSKRWGRRLPSRAFCGLGAWGGRRGDRNPSHVLSSSQAASAAPEPRATAERPPVTALGAPASSGT
jgi:hypothetical protein